MEASTRSCTASPSPLQPINLLFALIGVLLGTAVGVLPGIGPALTVALLLPITFKLDPAGSLIMFAGIYYGGMYGGSTTSILLNTPGESASIVTAIEGNKMAKAGRGGPALATAAIGSFVAGTIATLGIVFLAPWLVERRGQVRPGGLFRADVRRLHHGVGDLRRLAAARPHHRCSSGSSLGLVGIDKLTGQARLAFGMPELLDGIEVTTLAVGLFAVGEALYVASRRHLRRGEARAGARLALDDQGGLEALVAGRGCAARCSASRSARCRPAAPRSRRSCPIRPRSGSPSIRRNSATARSRASPARRPPTTPPPPARWCRC